MSDKAALLQDTNAAFEELRQSIDGLDDPAMERTWLGTWGVREILIHISGWHREAIAGLARIAQGESAPYPPGTYDDYDGWNARFVAQKTGVKLADVLTELDAAHRDFVRAATSVAEPYFADGTPVRGLVDGVGAGHYREHAAQIREWRQAA